MRDACRPGADLPSRGSLAGSDAPRSRCSRTCSVPRPDTRCCSSPPRKPGGSGSWGRDGLTRGLRHVLPRPGSEPLAHRALLRDGHGGGQRVDRELGLGWTGNPRKMQAERLARRGPREPTAGSATRTSPTRSWPRPGSSGRGCGYREEVWTTGPWRCGSGGGRRRGGDREVAAALSLGSSAGARAVRALIRRGLSPDRPIEAVVRSGRRELERYGERRLHAERARAGRGA